MEKAFSYIESLGVLEAIKKKLVRQPDPASKKLVQALHEISKIYTLLDSALTDYLSIEFIENDPEENRNGRKILIKNSGGGIAVDMAEAKPHCSKISAIYKTFLNPWFQRVLETEEQKRMEELFTGIRFDDSEMQKGIEYITYWLRQKSTEVLALVNKKNYSAANQKIMEQMSEIQPVRSRVLDAIKKLYSLQADFIEISGTVEG